MLLSTPTRTHLRRITFRPGNCGGAVAACFQIKPDASNPSFLLRRVREPFRRQPLQCLFVIGPREYQCGHRLSNTRPRGRQIGQEAMPVGTTARVAIRPHDPWSRNACWRLRNLGKAQTTHFADAISNSAARARKKHPWSQKYVQEPRNEDACVR